MARTLVAYPAASLVPLFAASGQPGNQLSRSWNLASRFGKQTRSAARMAGEPRRCLDDCCQKLQLEFCRARSVLVNSAACDNAAWSRRAVPFHQVLRSRSGRGLDASRGHLLQSLTICQPSGTIWIIEHVGDAGSISGPNRSAERLEHNQIQFRREARRLRHSRPSSRRLKRGTGAYFPEICACPLLTFPPF